MYNSPRRAQLVCFDVDSTFCVDESIDELAAFLGKGDAVAALTREAMGGTVSFGDALAARLDVMAVAQEDLEAFRDAHPPTLSPGALSQRPTEAPVGRQPTRLPILARSITAAAASALAARLQARLPDTRLV